MTLHLVRHGRAAAGVDNLDPDLDDVGMQQAERAATALRATGAQRLVVSPLRRTRATAAPIAALLGVTPEIRTEVAEVFDRDQTVENRSAMLGPLLSGCWSEQSEALRGYRQRVLDALVGLGNEPVIVVSHLVAICAAVGAATGDDRVVPCPIANASITTLEVQNGRLVLVNANDIRHLPPDLLTMTAALPGRGPT